jgi:hypothetical protein
LKSDPHDYCPLRSAGAIAATASIPEAAASGETVAEVTSGTTWRNPASSYARSGADLMSPVKTLRVPGPLRHQPTGTEGAAGDPRPL